jgi:murein DD-endopeptidase MepM/ murein hydrolase activator NlpD
MVANTSPAVNQLLEQPSSTFIAPLSNPTLDPTQPGMDTSKPREHIVQTGDTLYGISLLYNVSLDELLKNNELPNPNILSVGQVIKLPDIPNEQTLSFKIIPDSRLVRAPGSINFDVALFISQQGGYIRQAADTVPTNLATGFVYEETLTAAQIVGRISTEYSVDARLLLALLEYRAGWLTNPNLSDELKTNPLISTEASGDIDRSGLYKQLAWAANELNRGYYGWKNRGLNTLVFEDGTSLRFAPGLNAGTVGVQRLLSLNNSLSSWAAQVDVNGFYQTYAAYFGDPFIGAVEPLVPPTVQPPAMTFPFASGETWFFTGGPHGGWGSGSAWAAVDFAPPDELGESAPLCYTSDYWVRAVAPGVIVRSDKGAVVQDLDGDGDETTGWTILYLHLATEGRIETGKVVNPGDPIGHPSCEGGFSSATHMHIARRYNGEWIPAYCDQCLADQPRPPLIMNGWAVIGYTGQEYQGYMDNNGDRRIAEQGRLTPDNRVTW